MDIKKLRTIINNHAKWLQSGGKEGEKANLQGADLQGADLQGADLQRANLQRANLRWADLQRANLQRANLRWADLQRADLQGADLWRADLQRANLQGADLRRADLRRADLQEADFDFSSGIPLSCNGTNIKWDSRLFSQMIYHLTRQDNTCLADNEKDFLNTIPEEILNSFCSYRDDLKKLSAGGF